MALLAGFLAAAALGAARRYWLAPAVGRVGASPAGILAVNALGSFLLGALHHLEGVWVPIVGTALLGSFTSFSSFAVELFTEVRSRRYRAASTYLLAALITALGGAWAGLQMSG